LLKKTENYLDFQNTFIPKFKEETTKERRLREFYNTESTKYDTIKNNNNEENIENLNYSSNLNPKERRLRDLYPNVSQENLLSHREINNNFKEEKPKITNPKQFRIESMSSNIFHSKNKKKFDSNNNNNLEKKEKNEKTKENNRSIIKSKGTYSFDWVNTNTELVFKTNKKTDQKEYSAFKEKIKEQYSELNEKELFKNKHLKSNLNSMNNSNIIEVASVLKEKKQ